jgi:Ca2+-binding RTX toxin-like protein
VGVDSQGVSYHGGGGVDTLTNSGTINGDIHTGDGSDVFTDYIGAVQGKVLGTIDLGAGDDKFIGSSSAETVIDDDGSDHYWLGGGDDVFLAVGGSHPDLGFDTIDGGAGYDLYDASASQGVVQIVLGGYSQSDTGPDVLLNFEAAAGGAGPDHIVGIDSADGAGTWISGNGGDDYIAGSIRGDTLIGGTGLDYIVGGMGKDILIGGTGDGTDDLARDTFYYSSVLDSGTSKATRDVITDFVVGEDKIDISEIDANITAGHDGDNTFVWIGTNALFTHTAGELRAYWTATSQIVEGDTNGDGHADFSIELQYLAPDNVLSGGDFIL